MHREYVAVAGHGTWLAVLLKKVEPLIGMDILSVETALLKLFCLLSDREPTLNEKNFGANFPFMCILFFQKVLMCRKGNRKSQNCFSCKNG